MDLSNNTQELMGVQNRIMTENGSHVFMMKETFEETDFKGNNNTFNSLKTETNSNHSHEPSSLFQVNCTKEIKLEVDNSLFSYSSFKKAMDLRTHNRTFDGKKRTIFDDAEYFAKNYCYKLLPITFEQVDESIIQSEHNYSLSSLNSDSESEDDCSRTMDYSQIKEKNYKKRRTKLQEEEGAVEDESSESYEKEVDFSPMFLNQNEGIATDSEHQITPESLNTENSVPVQPLDLSAPPLVQEEKTDLHMPEHPSSIVGNDEVAQPDSDKENVNSEPNGIRVTITRPDEKENYQPCDLFLNDIARLVPWLIDKNCFEVDILDRTCNRHDEFRNHRLYYVISESTWRLFQGSNERVILTSDHSLGQPLTKSEIDERPSYLVFDQFSLAKCLADYCKEIGGCFEYACVEEEKNEEEIPENEVKDVLETTEKMKNVPEIIVKSNEKIDAQAKDLENEKIAEKKEEKVKESKEVLKLETCKVIKAVKKKNNEKKVLSNDNNQHIIKEKEKTNVVFAKRPKRTENKKGGVEKPNTQMKNPKVNKVKDTKQQIRGPKCRKESSIQPEPNSQITTRLRSTSGTETSQKSDKPVNRKGRKKRCPSLPKEPPKKRNKPAEPEDIRRITRSGKVLEKVKENKTVVKRVKENQNTEEVTERRLRSQTTQKEKHKKNSGIKR